MVVIGYINTVYVHYVLIIIEINMCFIPNTSKPEVGKCLLKLTTLTNYNTNNYNYNAFLSYLIYFENITKVTLNINYLQIQLKRR